MELGERIRAAVRHSRHRLAYARAHRFRQRDTDTQTNTRSETAYDTEAAPESAAKAVGRANN